MVMERITRFFAAVWQCICCCTEGGDGSSEHESRSQNHGSDEAVEIGGLIEAGEESIANHGQVTQGRKLTPLEEGLDGLKEPDKVASSGKQAAGHTNSRLRQRYGSSKNRGKKKAYLLQKEDPRLTDSVSSAKSPVCGGEVVAKEVSKERDITALYGRAKATRQYAEGDSGGVDSASGSSIGSLAMHGGEDRERKTKNKQTMRRGDAVQGPGKGPCGSLVGTGGGKSAGDGGERGTPQLDNTQQGAGESPACLAVEIKGALAPDRPQADRSAGKVEVGVGGMTVQSAGVELTEEGAASQLKRRRSRRPKQHSAAGAATAGEPREESGKDGVKFTIPHRKTNSSHNPVDEAATTTAERQRGVEDAESAGPMGCSAGGSGVAGAKGASSEIPAETGTSCDPRVSRQKNKTHRSATETAAKAEKLLGEPSREGSDSRMGSPACQKNKTRRSKQEKFRGETWTEDSASSPEKDKPSDHPPSSTTVASTTETLESQGAIVKRSLAVLEHKNHPATTGSAAASGRVQTGPEEDRAVAARRCDKSQSEGGSTGRKTEARPLHGSVGNDLVDGEGTVRGGPQGSGRGNATLSKTTSLNLADCQSEKVAWTGELESAMDNFLGGEGVGRSGCHRTSAGAECGDQRGNSSLARGRKIKGAARKRSGGSPGGGIFLGEAEGSSQLPEEQQSSKADELGKMDDGGSPGESLEPNCRHDTVDSSRGEKSSRAERRVSGAGGNSKPATGAVKLETEPKGMERDECSQSTEISAREAEIVPRGCHDTKAIEVDESWGEDGRRDTDVKSLPALRAAWGLETVGSGDKRERKSTGARRSAEDQRGSGKTATNGRETKGLAEDQTQDSSRSADVGFKVTELERELEYGRPAACTVENGLTSEDLGDPPLTRTLADSLPEKAVSLQDKADGLPDKTDSLPDRADRLPDKADSLQDQADSIPDKADGLPDNADTGCEGKTANAVMPKEATQIHGQAAVRSPDPCRSPSPEFVLEDWWVELACDFWKTDEEDVVRTVGRPRARDLRNNQAANQKDSGGPFPPISNTPVYLCGANESASGAESRQADGVSGEEQKLASCWDSAQLLELNYLVGESENCSGSQDSVTKPQAPGVGSHASDPLTTSLRGTFDSPVASNNTESLENAGDAAKIKRAKKKKKKKKSKRQQSHQNPPPSTPDGCANESGFKANVATRIRGAAPLPPIPNSSDSLLTCQRADDKGDARTRSGTKANGKESSSLPDNDRNSSQCAVETAPGLDMCLTQSVSILDDSNESAGDPQRPEMKSAEDRQEVEGILSPTDGASASSADVAKSTEQARDKETGGEKNPYQAYYDVLELLSKPIRIVPKYLEHDPEDDPKEPEPVVPPNTYGDEERSDLIDPSAPFSILDDSLLTYVYEEEVQQAEGEGGDSSRPDEPESADESCAKETEPARSPYQDYYDVMEMLSKPIRIVPKYLNPDEPEDTPKRAGPAQTAARNCDASGTCRQKYGNVKPGGAFGAFKQTGSLPVAGRVGNINATGKAMAEKRRVRFSEQVQVSFYDPDPFYVLDDSLLGYDGPNGDQEPSAPPSQPAIASADVSLKSILKVKTYQGPQEPVARRRVRGSKGSKRDKMQPRKRSARGKKNQVVASPGAQRTANGFKGSQNVWPTVEAGAGALGSIKMVKFKCDHEGGARLSQLQPGLRSADNSSQNDSQSRSMSAGDFWNISPSVVNPGLQLHRAGHAGIEAPSLPAPGVGRNRRARQSGGKASAHEQRRMGEELVYYSGGVDPRAYTSNAEATSSPTKQFLVHENHYAVQNGPGLVQKDKCRQPQSNAHREPTTEKEQDVFGGKLAVAPSPLHENCVLYPGQPSRGHDNHPPRSQDLPGLAREKMLCRLRAVPAQRSHHCEGASVNDGQDFVDAVGFEDEYYQLDLA